MRYLLDTHVFLWSLTGGKELPSSIAKILTDSANQIKVSVVTAWEISIKHAKGKLPLRTTLEECFEVSSFDILPVYLEHILEIEKMPVFHSDPFDRLLISQALSDNLTFITADEKIWKYNLPLIKVQ